MKPFPWSRVFRIVWRINGLALLLLLGFAVVAAGSLLVPALLRSAGSKEVPQPNVAPAVKGRPELRLDGFERIPGTRVLRADLRAPTGDSFSSYKGGSSVSHNVLFLDARDGKSWWLLPDSDSDILSEQAVTLSEGSMEVPLAKVFLVGDPARPDGSRLLLMDLMGLKRATLAQGDLRLDEVVAFGRDEARVLYHDPAGYHLVTLNPTDIAKVRETAVSFAFPPRK